MRFRCSAGIQSVEFHGQNQNGDYTMWSDSPGGPNQVTAPGYWKGPLYINYQVVGRVTWYQDSFNVPKIWFGPGGVWEAQGSTNPCFV